MKKNIAIRLEELTNSAAATNFIKIVLRVIADDSEIQMERLAPMEPNAVRDAEMLLLSDADALLLDKKTGTEEHQNTVEMPKRRRRSKKESLPVEEREQPLSGQVEFPESKHEETVEGATDNEDDKASSPVEPEPVSEEPEEITVGPDEETSDAVVAEEKTPVLEHPVEVPSAEEETSVEESVESEELAGEVAVEEEPSVSETAEPKKETASEETKVSSEDELTPEEIAEAGAVLCTYRPEFAAKAEKKQWASYAGKPLLKMANECASMMRVIVRNIRLGKMDRIFITDEGIQAIQILDKAREKGMLPEYHE